MLLASKAVKFRVNLFMLGYLVRHYIRHKRDIYSLRRWYGKAVTDDRIAMTILVLLNVIMWAWYVYFVYQ